MKRNSIFAGVALYARVSTVEQAAGQSIPAQLDALRSWANQHDHTVHAEYVDAAVSGNIPDRPGLSRLVRDAQGRAFETVLVYRFDRLFRDVRLFLNFEHELRQYGIRLVSVTEEIQDTCEGRLQLLIKSSFAEYERAVIHARATAGRIRAAKNGKWMGGDPPYGYRLDRTTSKLLIEPAEAPWVQQFYRWMVDDHLTLRQLQERVNRLGIPTRWDRYRRPKAVNPLGWWVQRTLDRILTRELYTGVYNYRRICKPRSVKYRDATIRPEEDWIPIAVPPLISRDLFERAQAQLRQNARLGGRRRRDGTLSLAA